ncbi:hypothetical protein BDW22DRAFT_1355266 [Trametopsis cervina]|nr:hypothetical protein BDW22DRAFT_1355266 [Trametopsis cervina]
MSAGGLCNNKDSRRSSIRYSSNTSRNPSELTASMRVIGLLVIGALPQRSSFSLQVTGTTTRVVIPSVSFEHRGARKGRGF